MTISQKLLAAIAAIVMSVFAALAVNQYRSAMKQAESDARYVGKLAAAMVDQAIANPMVTGQDMLTRETFVSIGKRVQGVSAVMADPAGVLKYSTNNSKATLDELLLDDGSHRRHR